MKKILGVLLLIFLLHSCKALMGVNYEKVTKELSLGMTKQEVLQILGKDYYIESLSNTDEGKLEVLTFYKGHKNNQAFTLYFLNDKLKEFNKYVPPYVPQEVKVVKE